MSIVLDFIKQRFISFMPSDSNSIELGQLISPSQHSALIKQHRATMIVNRVRFFAMLFALLTPLWGIVDVLAFEPNLWMQLAVLRLLTCLAFTALLIFYRPSGSLFDAYRAIAILFIIPTAFYVASHSLLSTYALNNVSAAVASGYAFLPFLLMAGLSIFPLSITENILLASVLLIAQGLAGYLNWSTLNWPSYAGGFWLLILIAGVTTLASTSQLAFMISLVRQANYDPLTQALARRSGQDTLALQWAHSVEHQSHFSIAFIDIDHFKAVNDQFGHDAGDAVLRDFAACLHKNLRATDSLLRWGGEEFVIIMPRTTLTQAHEALQRLQAQGFGQRPDGNPLTASMGIVERIEDGIETELQLMTVADQRMYAAKEAGRNRICASGSMVDAIVETTVDAKTV